MAEATHNEHEALGTLTARLDDLATCAESSFNPDFAVDAIEDAIGGSMASDTHRAAIVDFSSEDIAHLEEVVKRFDRNPPALNDNADLELYADMIGEAEMLIGLRKQQIADEARLGGRTARINMEMSQQQAAQRRIFLDSAHNTLNAAGDLGRKRTKKLA